MKPLELNESTPHHQAIRRMIKEVKKYRKILIMNIMIKINTKENFEKIKEYVGNVEEWGIK